MSRKIRLVETDEPTGKPCPICGKPALLRVKPFCSKRCADIDLGRWLNESYRVPVRPEDEDEDEGDGSPSSAPVASPDGGQKDRV